MNSPISRPPGPSVRLRLREIDQQVAYRVRARRVMLGLTMQQLATMVGVTYQQLYKYENGTNRIAAGRLHAIARALGIDVSYFFADVATEEQAVVTPERRQLLELLRNFMAIRSRRHQEALCALARAIATTGAPDAVARSAISTGSGGHSPRRALPAGANPVERILPPSAA
jgi:transcriptional regulator with XRE-family HTH domain